MSHRYLEINRNNNHPDVGGKIGTESNKCGDNDCGVEEEEDDDGGGAIDDNDNKVEASVTLSTIMTRKWLHLFSWQKR